MNLRNNFKLNKITSKVAFLLLLLAVSLSAMFVLTAYAEDAVSPAKPSGFEAKSGSGAITLSWTANTATNLSGYNIYRNTTETTVGASLAASVEASATSYEDTSVVQSTTYYYWLSALDTATPPNESEKAGPVSASLSSGKQSGTYKDITNAHWARDYIEDLLASGIVNGYGDNTFRPQSDVTRAEFAKMICEIMVKRANWVLNTETSSSLTGVPEGHWSSPYIQAVIDRGVMVGYKSADGSASFKPDKNITRAEIAKIISNVLQLERGEGKLKDVSNHWAKENINACVKAGIISGYKNGNFEPNSFATRAEVCKMLVKMMKLLDTQKNKGKNTKS